MDQDRIVNRVIEAFDGDLGVIPYRADDKCGVDLLRCVDSPVPGLSSYATLGVHQFPNAFAEDGREIRVEFVGFCYSSNQWFPALLSSCAFGVMQGKALAFPNAVYHNIIPLYDDSLEVKHLMLIRPFGWKRKLGTLEFDQQLVTWLMVNPITDGELAYLEEHGPEKLLEAFTKENVQVHDLNRKSIF